MPVAVLYKAIAVLFIRVEKFYKTVADIFIRVEKFHKPIAKFVIRVERIFIRVAKFYKPIWFGELSLTSSRVKQGSCHACQLIVIELLKTILSYRPHYREPPSNQI